MTPRGCSNNNSLQEAEINISVSVNKRLQQIVASDSGHTTEGWAAESWCTGAGVWPGSSRPAGWWPTLWSRPTPRLHWPNQLYSIKVTYLKCTLYFYGYSYFFFFFVYIDTTFKSIISMLMKLYLILVTLHDFFNFVYQGGSFCYLNDIYS